MAWFLRIVCGLIVIIGGVAVVGGLPGRPFATWPVGLVTTGTALVTAGLAALVAMQAAVSWSTQRRREIEASEREHREAVYEELLTHMTSVFTGGPKTDEAAVRSKVALWGSGEVLGALRNWNSETYKVMKRSGDGSTTPEERIALWDKYHAVIAAARRDLNPDTNAETVSKDRVLGMIFNGYVQDGQSKASLPRGPERSEASTGPERPARSADT